MPVTATCPDCQATYKLPEAMFGKQVRCKKCQKIFPVGKPAAKSAKPGPALPAAKPTMMADDEAARGVGAAPAKTGKLSAPRRPAPGDEDEVVEAQIAPPGKPRPASDDDEVVEAQAAPPRSRDDEIVEVQAAAPRPPVGPPASRPKEPPPPRPRRDYDEEDRDHGDRDRERDDRDRDSDDDPDRRGDRREDYDDYDSPAPPRKRRLGLILGLVGGVAAILAGVAVLFFVLLKSDPADDPEVARNIEKLKEGTERESAILFFMTYEKPETQKRRQEVAQNLELIVKNRLGVAGLHEDLIHAYCRWATPENLPGLSEALDRLPAPDVRKRIISTLAEFKQPQAAEVLAARVRRDLFDRGAAIKGLEVMGEVGEKELAKFVFDADFGIRRDAMDALRRMGTKDDKFLDGALTAVNDRLHPNRQAAVDFLRNFRDPPADRSKEVCTKLLAVLAERTHNPNAESVLKAAENWSTKESVALVIDGAFTVLNDKTHPHRSAAMQFISTFRDPPADRARAVCERLANLVREKAFIFSDQAAAAMGNWITKDSASVVARALIDANPGMNCEKIMRSLAPFKDQPDVPEAIAKRMESFNTAESDLAARLLEEMGPAISTRATVSLMHSPNHRVRDKARLMMSKLGISQDAMIAQSIKDLASTNNQVRDSALEFMTKATPHPKMRDEAAKVLNGLLYTEDFFLRERVFNCAAVWWNTATSEIWIKMSADTVNQQVRHKAIQAMGKTGHAGFATYIAARLPANEDRFVARDALTALGAGAEGEVAKYLFHKDSSTRIEAAQILSKVGTKNSIMALQNALATYGMVDRNFGNHATNAIKAIASR